MENTEETKILTEEELILTEEEKMLAGQVYDAADPALVKGLCETRDLIYEFNNLHPSESGKMDALLRRILGGCGEQIHINQPFRCDFGKNIKVGERFFANFSFTVLDEGYVTIGDDCFVGPNVSIYTACHSTDPVERKARREWAEPVKIGNSVWIGGGTIILPGVTIGDDVTIGAGSVVTRDIPSGSVAVGNPARVIRRVAGYEGTMDLKEA